MQEVLLRVHERRDQLRERERLEAWVFRIARNALVDHYRRGAGDLPLAAELEPRELPREHADDAAPILAAWLRARVEALPPAQREALELTELGGLSQRAAAEHLGVPTSTLKSRVQRGRDRLHAELIRCCEVELDARGGVTDFRPRDPEGCGGCECG